MVKYNLGDDLREQEKQNESKEAYLNEVHDQKILKAIFKDKKLNKLWSKAEASGFTGMEAKMIHINKLNSCLAIKYIKVRLPIVFHEKFCHIYKVCYLFDIEN